MRDLSKFDEKILLYLFDELSTSEKHEFEDLLKNDSELNLYFQQSKLFYNAIKEARLQEVSSEEINHARLTLFNSLANETSNENTTINFLQQILNLISGNLKLAGAAFSILIVGVFIGYLFFSPKLMINSDSKNINIDELIKSNPDYVLQDVSLSSGVSDEISITLDGEKRITFSGRLNDPTIQYLISKALVSSKNDGIRLKTVNTIYSQTLNQKIVPDEKIKNALIKTAKYDSNPAVRKNALQVLNQYNFDNQIRDTYLFALSNDKNSGNRILAINFLSDVTSQQKNIDENLIRVLSERKKNDGNSYIQNKSEILLRGINQ